VNVAELRSFRYHENTEKPQRFLWSAWNSVWGMLLNLEILRELDRDTGHGRGRMSHGQTDLLLAAITFTGAGLDATLKELIKEALPTVLEKSSVAQEQFRDFVERHLAGEPSAIPRKLSSLLTVADARKALIDRYVAELTGDSLQSSDQLLKSARSLGIAQAHLIANKAQLNQFFRARNEIVHELDLQHTTKPGDSSRRSRKLGATVADCDLIFRTAQAFIDDVALLLDPQAPLTTVKVPAATAEPPRKGRAAASSPKTAPDLAKAPLPSTVTLEISGVVSGGNGRRRRSKLGGGGGS